MYCDYETYRAMGGHMTQAQFDLYGQRAAGRIDALTLGRAELYVAKLKDELARANAAMADLLLAAETSSQAAACGLTAANTDGYSESYADAHTARRGLDAALRTALRDALGADPYGLLWQGVC